MEFEWTPKQDEIDDILAKDINYIALKIKDLIDADRNNLKRLNPLEVSQNPESDEYENSEANLGTYAGMYMEWKQEDGAWRVRLYRANNGETEENRNCSRIPITRSDGTLLISTPGHDNGAVPRKYADERYVKALTTKQDYERAYVQLATSGSASSRPVSREIIDGMMSIPLRDKTSQNFHVGNPTKDTHVVNLRFLKSYIPENGGLLSGTGEDSLQSANAGEAIADNSIALGPGAVSGVRGYYIKSVDLTAKKIYLTKTQTQPVMSTADNTDVTFETPAYEIGQEFVTVNSMHYWPINVTIKSVNHNVIEYDDPDGNGIGYTSFAVMAEAARDPHDFSFFVPMQPTIGGTSLKPGGVGIGYEVYVLSKYGFGGGYKCIVFGNYGTALGRGNRAGGSALAGGQDCWALANQSIALGLRLRAIADSQSVLGRHNRPDKTLAHMIGNGKSDVNRSNCHEVTWDGKAWYADKIYMGGASIHDPDAKVAATEEYVNIKSETAGGAGRWSLTPYIDGVSAGLKISLLYPIDYTVWRVWLEDKDISGELQPNNSFITAPLIFEDATKVKITLESDGVELLALSLNNVYKNDNIQIGNLLIKEEVTA